MSRQSLKRFAQACFRAQHLRYGGRRNVHGPVGAAKDSVILREGLNRGDRHLGALTITFLATRACDWVSII
jgi:hypothetical protein